MKTRTPLARGFTLLELLVSMAVLALVVVLAAGVVQMAAGSWLAGKAQADNFAKARSALDLIAREVRAGVFQPGVTAFVAPNGTTDFRFYSRRAGTQGGRGLQLLGYSVGGLEAAEPSPHEIGLFRTSQRLDFSERPNLTDPPTFDPSSQTQQIGPGILAFAFRFHTPDGQTSPEFVNDPAQPLERRTGVLRIACAVVDDRTLDLLVHTASLKAVTQALDDAARSSSQSPAVLWERTFDELVEAETIPQRVRNGMRTYEFTLSLPLSNG